MTRRELFEGMIAKLGAKHQAAVCIEECAELTKELTKHIRDKGNMMRACEEIADVEICLAQMKLLFDPDDRHVALFKRFKVARLRQFFLEGGEK